MTTERPSAAVFSNELGLLTKQPLDQADDEALVRAACAVWYSDANLENAIDLFLRNVPTEVEVRRVGYLLERLTQFNCLTDDRASEALRVLDTFSSHKSGNVMKKGRTDRLALAWGLEKGLGLKAQALMPFQTRHFEATQRLPVTA